MSSADDDDSSAQTDQTAVIEPGPDEEPAPESVDPPEAERRTAATEPRVRVRDVAKAGDELWSTVGQVAAAVAARVGVVYAPARVRCPQRATTGCTGSLRLVSRKLFQVTPALVPKHVVIGPVPLRLVGAKSGNTIGSGVTGYVCPEVPVSTRGVLRNIPAVGDPKSMPTVQFELIVSSDAAGHDVVRRTNYALTTPPKGVPIPRLQGCSK